MPPVAAPPPAPVPDECRPGLGAAVDVSDVAQRLAEHRPLGAPRNASLAGVIDRAVLCPGVADDVPSLAAGPIVLACVRLGLPVDLRNVVVAGGDLELIDVAAAEAVTLATSRLGGELYLAATSIGGALSVFDSELVEGADLGNAAIEGELALIGSRFGAPVLAGSAKLGSAPRIAACTPADPLQVVPEGGDVE